MPERAKVLVIGDSISMGYCPAVAEALSDRAEVVHNPGNGGDTDNVLANLDAWLGEAEPDVVSLNAGLHDLKFDRRRHVHQVPLDRYRANLEEIIDRLSAGTAGVLWVTTTPVIEPWHQAARDFDRHNRDVDACNAVALEIARAAGLPVCDLHAAVLKAGPEKMLSPDGVHYGDEAYATLGRRVAASLGELLDRLSA